jgi:hypothetical protein
METFCRATFRHSTKSKEDWKKKKKKKKEKKGVIQLAKKLKLNIPPPPPLDNRPIFSYPGIKLGLIVLV